MSDSTNMTKALKALTERDLLRAADLLRQTELLEQLKADQRILDERVAEAQKHYQEACEDLIGTVANGPPGDTRAFQVGNKVVVVGRTLGGEAPSLRIAPLVVDPQVVQ